MNIYGLNKTTLLDYPEHLAATIFTGGCNFRCPFCHNAGLVLDPGSQPVITEEEVLQYLKKRRGILQGICITGGEPTLQPDLADFIRKVKALGYLVKLDTNGARPQVLRELLVEKLLDYVAMDIKASKENYGKAIGISMAETNVLTVQKDMGEKLLQGVEESVELLKNSGIPYEFRTTVVAGIHSIEEFEAIGRWLSGCNAYYLQAYREGDNILADQVPLQSAGINAQSTRISMESFTKKDMEYMAEIARKYIDKVALRGVE